MTKPSSIPTPVIWCIAGIDSGGGAGLAADQRAADAFGVHACTVVAAVTAQSTKAVQRIEATEPAMLDAQLRALAEDMLPVVIKTGMLGSAENARRVAHWVQKFRHSNHPVKLVVDPVLRASTGASLADDALVRAYREALVPLCDVITPTRREAQILTGLAEDACARELAAHLCALGAQSAVVTGGDDEKLSPDLACDWLETPHAKGWLYLRRRAIAHNHGTGCTFASSVAAAMAMGFVAADAAVLAKMATMHAIRHARPVGMGAGPVIARGGFGTDSGLLPRLSIGQDMPQSWRPPAPSPRSPGLYAIVGTAEQAQAVMQVRNGAHTVQLRMKRPADMAADDPSWQEQLKNEIESAIAAASTSSACLVINDHWRTALACGAKALHLGQEDLLALTRDDWQALESARASHGVQIGVSSHSLWELCRAASISPELIACGPVWPTTTKDMPWVPQGLRNLAWWAYMAPAPVVGIGGVLEPDQMRAIAASGAQGGCVVRGLGEDPSRSLPAWRHAWDQGCTSSSPGAAPPLPHPTLSPHSAEIH
ncbi:bifunctional hydroxymethylpyrimidine kinase/phosphomethylpyrimidine kinase [Hydrogenophaga sp. 5NK40-0174]|uniref:PfkB family carbohydrate kinase n=1 Tax=Hydrogenophaga sp. 5NK40-0174 TaxID=3127649 RepID=UPI003101E054